MKHFEYSSKCILGHTIATLSDLTRQECAQACVDLGSALCHGVGYSADNGNEFLANDCLLYSSVVENGCNNFHYQLELFSITGSKHSEDDPYVRITRAAFMRLSGNTHAHFSLYSPSLHLPLSILNGHAFREIN